MSRAENGNVTNSTIPATKPNTTHKLLRSGSASLPHGRLGRFLDRITTSAGRPHLGNTSAQTTDAQPVRRIDVLCPLSPVLPRQQRHTLVHVCSPATDNPMCPQLAVRLEQSPVAQQALPFSQPVRQSAQGERPLPHPLQPLRPTVRQRAPPPREPYLQRNQSHSPHRSSQRRSPNCQLVAPASSRR